MESKSCKLWILIRNEVFRCYLQDNPLVTKDLQESIFEPIFISELTELKMEHEDKALVFMPETEAALHETSTPDLWRKFMFTDAMFNDSIYAVHESELRTRIADGQVFTKIRGVIHELSRQARITKPSYLNASP